jgi:predicted enzyme related to lactoylglutathione lyase
MARLSINVDVDDLQKGMTFYAAAVGLRPVRRLGDFAVELAGAEVPVFLLRKPASAPPFPGSAGGRSYARHWTPDHVDFLVDELASAVTQALAAGATAESDVQTYDWGKMALMADPFGNGFCLIELDPAGYGAVGTPL